ncbi:MAG: hypothetical protein C0600_07000 [Ignavibacteria bacterium]|nr:MAG: hypothetical protein C0600_07000 [Ignavibacteria bacterium]
MKLIRYSIRKDDLHQLLHAIGVLQKNEHLLAVNNADLADQGHEAVLITVSAEQKHSTLGDHENWTDEEIQQRFAELRILEDSATQQLRGVMAELEALQRERERRSMDSDRSDDGIPGAVEKNIRDQLRGLLGEDRGG